jgi:hypothetical protein
LKRIVATTNLANISSQKVLEKAELKFKKKGNFDGFEMDYYEINR